MTAYRKKPVVIEARQLSRENFAEIAEWAGVTECWGLDTPIPALHIRTLEGTMKAHLGDYVIRGVAGEFYPCKPDIFEQTYEPAGELTAVGNGPLLDPDCRDGKHGSCVGAPCECECHHA